MREKSQWSIDIEILNSMMGSKLFELPVLDFEECQKLSTIIHGETTIAEILGGLTPFTAKQLFVQHNLKLARQICLKYHRIYPQIEIEDLFQMGIVGLIRAVEKWDPAREFMFSTYATWWIRQSITRNVADIGSPIRVPVHFQDRIGKVEEYLENYREFFGFEPELLEAADALLISEKEYLEIRSAMFRFESINSITQPSGELYVRTFSPGIIDSSYSDPLLHTQWALLSEQLSGVLDTLSSREAGIIAMRFGIGIVRPMTLEEIGTFYGLTRERIRQIETVCMKKLRHPSRSQVLREYLQDYTFEMDQLPHTEVPPNFVVYSEPQD